jgi:hypothetical protein
MSGMGAPARWGRRGVKGRGQAAHPRRGQADGDKGVIAGSAKAVGHSAEGKCGGAPGRRRSRERGVGAGPGGGARAKRGAPAVVAQHATHTATSSAPHVADSSRTTAPLKTTVSADTRHTASVAGSSRLSYGPSALSLRGRAGGPKGRGGGRQSSRAAGSPARSRRSRHQERTQAAPTTKALPTQPLAPLPPHVSMLARLLKL